MGLLAEKGEMPYAEDLASLGIHYKNQDQAVAFRKMWNTTEGDPRKMLEDGLSYEDMNVVMGMLQEVSGEDEEVSYLDAAALFQTSITKSIMSHDPTATERVREDLKALNTILGQDIPGLEGEAKAVSKEQQTALDLQGLMGRLDTASSSKREPGVTIRDISLVMDVLQNVRGEEATVSSQDAGVVMQNLMMQSVMEVNEKVTSQHKAELTTLGLLMSGGIPTEATLAELGGHEPTPELERSFQ